MPSFRSDDIEIYYEVKGTGPRLLFISGTGADLRKKPGIFDSKLPEVFTLASFDQRGLGRSGKPDRPYSMEEYADDAARLLDELGWPDAFVVGVSFGGMVAQHLALRHPGRISRLVLACTSSGGAGGASYPLHELQDLSSEEKAHRLIPINDTRCTPVWIEANRAAYDQLVQQAITGSEFGGEEPGHHVGAFRQLEARRTHDTFPRLGEITMPVMIAAGKYDGITPAENQHALVGALPDASLAFFEGGHLFLLQDPKAWAGIVGFLLA